MTISKCQHGYARDTDRPQGIIVHCHCPPSVRPSVPRGNVDRQIERTAKHCSDEYDLSWGDEMRSAVTNGQFSRLRLAYISVTATAICVGLRRSSISLRVVAVHSGRNITKARQYTLNVKDPHQLVFSTFAIITYIGPKRVSKTCSLLSCHASLHVNTVSTLNCEMTIDRTATDRRTDGRTDIITISDNDI